MAKDFYHEQVKAALRKDGWKVTHHHNPHIEKIVAWIK